jgi:hypothetical protein
VTRIPTVPHDAASEEQLSKQVVELTRQLDETLRRLADARAELAIRRRIAVGSVPAWLRPVKAHSIAELVLNALRHNSPNGLKFSELVDELRRAGRQVNKKSLTAILGRLRRNDQIVLERGRWREFRSSDREREE